MRQAANPYDVRGNAEAKAREAEARDLEQRTVRNDLAWLMQSPQGRRVAKWLIHLADPGAVHGVPLGDAFDTNAMTMARYAGRKGVATDVYKTLLDVSPASVVAMTEESKEP